MTIKDLLSDLNIKSRRSNHLVTESAKFNAILNIESSFHGKSSF